MAHLTGTHSRSFGGSAWPQAMQGLHKAIANSRFGVGDDPVRLFGSFAGGCRGRDSDAAPDDSADR